MVCVGIGCGYILTEGVGCFIGDVLMFVVGHDTLLIFSTSGIVVAI